MHIHIEDKKNYETKEFQARKDAINDSLERQQERIEKRLLKARSHARSEYDRSQGVTATVNPNSATNTHALPSST